MLSLHPSLDPGLHLRKHLASFAWSPCAVHLPLSHALETATDNRTGTLAHAYRNILKVRLVKVPAGTSLTRLRSSFFRRTSSVTLIPLESSSWEAINWKFWKKSRSDSALPRLRKRLVGNA